MWVFLHSLGVAERCHEGELPLTVPLPSIGRGSNDRVCRFHKHQWCHEPCSHFHFDWLWVVSSWVCLSRTAQRWSILVFAIAAWLCACSMPASTSCICVTHWHICPSVKEPGSWRSVAPRSQLLEARPCLHFPSSLYSEEYFQPMLLQQWRCMGNLHSNPTGTCLMNNNGLLSPTSCERTS